MKIYSQNKFINIDKDYNLEEIAKFNPCTAFSNIDLARSIIYGMEAYLAKIVAVIIDNPECEKDEKFWIECKINQLISYYIKWFRAIIKSFDSTILLTRLPVKQITIEVKLTIEFKGDENNYTYSYIFTKVQERDK